MKAWYVLVVGLLFVVGITVGFFVSGVSLTGEAVRDLEEYSYTQAICSGGGCIDVVVSCRGGSVVGIEPIFYLIEHEEGWVDPREGLVFCE